MTVVPTLYRSIFLPLWSCWVSFLSSPCYVVHVLSLLNFPFFLTLSLSLSQLCPFFILDCYCLHEKEDAGNLRNRMNSRHTSGIEINREWTVIELVFFVGSDWNLRNDVCENRNHHSMWIDLVIWPQIQNKASLIVEGLVMIPKAFSFFVLMGHQHDKVPVPVFTWKCIFFFYAPSASDGEIAQTLIVSTKAKCFVKT